jgi:structural maintenance of chromosomes protein 6
MCTLAVKLKNQGPSAYKSDQYGASIIVERHFSRSGTNNGFKLKNSSGGIVSTKRADLDELLDAWSLQLDNPMNVLTQDQARQFLNRSDPSHKYRFFMNGTQLAALDHAYRSLDDVLESIDNILDGTKDALQEKRQEFEETQKRVEIAEKQKGLQGKISEVVAQCAWAQVEDQEGELVKRDEDIRNAQEALRLRTEEAAVTEEKSQEATNVHQRAEEQCREIQASLHPAEEALEEAKSQFQDNKTMLQNLISEQRTIGNEVTTYKKRKEQLTSDIHEEQLKISGANEGLGSSKVQDLEDAKESHRQAERDRQELRDQYDDLQSAKDQAQEALNRGQARLKHTRDDKDSCQSSLRQLERSRGDWTAAYNPNLPQLLRAINNENRFQKKPVGPVGRHVRLLKDEWSRVIELYVGNALNAFIVTNKNDQKVLSELMSRTRCELPIQIGNERAINTSSNEPHPDVLTMKRALEIDNPLVFNSLVINQSMEQVALIQDRDEAFEFMFSGSRPPKVAVCLCLHDDAGLRLAYSSAGAQSVVPVRPRPGESNTAPKMKGNDEYRIRTERERLSQKQNEVDEVEKAKRQLEEDLKRANQAIRKHQLDTHEHNLAVQQAEEHVHQLQQELEDQTPHAGRLEALEQEVAEVEQNLRMTEGSFRDSVNERDQLNQKARSLKQNVDARQEEFDELTAKLNKAQITARNLDDKRIYAIAANNAAIKKTDDASGGVVQAEDARRQQMDLIREFVESAEQISPRVSVPAGQTYSSLEKTLARLQKQKETAEKQ